MLFNSLWRRLLILLCLRQGLIVRLEGFSLSSTTSTTNKAGATIQPSKSVTCSPYDILYPSHYDASSDKTTTSSSSISPVSLEHALHLTRQALKRLVQQPRDPQHVVDDSVSILRLHVSLTSHAVDPLAWLDRQQQQQSGQQEALFYLNTLEGFQVAVVESALTLYHTTEVWPWLEHLPKESKFYGGARFDNSTTAHDTNGNRTAWSDFGGGTALWMLPLLEVVVQHHNTSTLAIHLVRQPEQPHSSWSAVAASALSSLQSITHHSSPPVPPTTLPPILSRRDSSGHDLYEQGMTAALSLIHNRTLQKVVLARQQWLQFHPQQPSATPLLRGLSILKKWNYGHQETGGHLFWLAVRSHHNAHHPPREFFGCTPERLFHFSHHHHRIETEALAGTRPRGSSHQDDELLLQELFASAKDRTENELTGQHIEAVLQGMEGMLQLHNASGVFVRRLLHLQHICQRYTARVLQDVNPITVTRQLFERLHPTPAVCGVPVDAAMECIRLQERIGFDRGFYSGPIGYIGAEESDILVAIRSGLITHDDGGATTLLSFAGAGIVEGSTLQSEWAETNYKLAVLASLFPQSPVSLQSAPTPNVAWATAFIEELIRNGVTQFYICPGSRSTPLVVAIAKAVRTHVGVVQAISVHDERSAGFRTLGYGKGTGRPAAIVTSSGTAVANLYPAIVEASMDGVPLLVLTADRPYESRHTGANQAIDQVKIFSDSYIRWFRDIPPPDDQVPVSVALSDANHAVQVARALRGPVHVNIQFRENLAPDAGPIRNDGRVDSVTRFNGFRFTDVPGYQRWSRTGSRWMKSFYGGVGQNVDQAAQDVARLVASSKRGIIVVGNLRPSTNDHDSARMLDVVDAISDFAQMIGFPILAGAQSASLRFRSSAVVPFAEHILRCPAVADNLNPDLILQFGAPLVLTSVSNVIQHAMKVSPAEVNHVLVHPLTSNERSDPEFTVTLSVSSEISPFLSALKKALHDYGTQVRSELSPLVLLGRKLRSEMKGIIEASALAVDRKLVKPPLTEPEIVLALAEYFQGGNDAALFLSNSMPVRDCEFFLYPFDEERANAGPVSVGTNRGASGIDGIIATATGFAESTKKPTVLLMGDLAALHDLNSMHSLTNEVKSATPSSKKINPLTTVIVNNDGGGIFSFLPIAQHGTDVSFNEFFGTPTNSFSYAQGAAAFGLPIESVADLSTFRKSFARALQSKKHSVIEAKVAGREMNVAVHKEIGNRVNAFVQDVVTKSFDSDALPQRLPIKYFGSLSKVAKASSKCKTMLLVHGWMGDKSEWDEVGSYLAERMSEDWRIIAIDLPGHGRSPFQLASDIQVIRTCLGLSENTAALGIDALASSILDSLHKHHQINQIDAIVGYSLGGRVALAINRLCGSQPISVLVPKMVSADTKLVLLSSYPGDVGSDGSIESIDLARRLKKDEAMAADLKVRCSRSILCRPKSVELRYEWEPFVSRWYGQEMWGNLCRLDAFKDLSKKRSRTLSTRGWDLAAVLLQCSPPNNARDDWKYVSSGQTLFVAGELDGKYSAIGDAWNEKEMVMVEKLLDLGHALLVEAPMAVCNLIADFLDSTSVADKVVDQSVTTVESPLPTSVPRMLDVSQDQKSVKETMHGYDRSTNARAMGSMEIVEFSIVLVDEDRRKSQVFGIGWGDRASVSDASGQSTRRGFVVQVGCTDSVEAGIGEVSPLQGLHPESMHEAANQLQLLQSAFQSTNESIRVFDADQILRLDGGLQSYLRQISTAAGLEALMPSVHSGLEMALLSLSAQVVGLPIHQALCRHQSQCREKAQRYTLPVNGLISRGAIDSVRSGSSSHQRAANFPSMKVKIGHQSLAEDSLAMSRAFQRSGLSTGSRKGKIRTDANRAWNESQAIEFALALDGIDLHSVERLEFIEEPLIRQSNESGLIALAAQVEALERLFHHTGILYALDESLADLVVDLGHEFDAIRKALLEVYASGARGCAAFVLKPALLGVELSYRLATVARNELGIGAVFSSSFDSGVGLAYTAFLGGLADAWQSTARTYAHGIGTYTLLGSDTLSPPFATYVNENGILNTASLSRAFFGLTLDDVRGSLLAEPLVEPDDTLLARTKPNDEYEASTATSSSGKEISVVVSLPLPFSAEIANSRFTDLPQQSRWSPWISSVAYRGAETEWTLNVRGIPLRWRATSHLLKDPLGIEWESVSGLKNRGSVEFVPDSPESCTMTVHMTILTPRLLRPLFQGTSLFVEDYLRDKLLKWSLEMFRDVVKADLALERGDVELGDALYGAVEGRANAIEATLNSSPGPANGEQ